jgi:hypothetical protein
MKQPGRTRTLSVALLCSLALVTLVPVADAATWHVRQDGLGHATTIQGGVDLASDGDSVVVSPGTYPDASNRMIDGVPHSVGVFIAKNVKLVSTSGPGVTTIGSPSMDIAVYFENVGSSAELAGFRIETLNEGYACVDALSPGGLHSQSSTIIHLGIKCNAASPRVDGNENVSNRIGVEMKGG